MVSIVRPKGKRKPNMKLSKIVSNGLKRVGMLFVILGIFLPMSSCGVTTVSGDAGCVSYAEARLDMPREVPLPRDAWGSWIGKTDTRMSGTCASG